jgi:hypothetical protein
MAWRPESDEAPDHWEPLFYGDDGMVTFANEAEAERAVMRARDDGRVVVGTILAFAPLEYTALVWEHPELHSVLTSTGVRKPPPLSGYREVNSLAAAGRLIVAGRAGGGGVHPQRLVLLACDIAESVMSFAGEKLGRRRVQIQGDDLLAAQLPAEAMAVARAWCRSDDDDARLRLGLRAAQIAQHLGSLAHTMERGSAAYLALRAMEHLALCVQYATFDNLPVYAEVAEVERAAVAAVGAAFGAQEKREARSHFAQIIAHWLPLPVIALAAVGDQKSTRVGYAGTPPGAPRANPSIGRRRRR